MKTSKLFLTTALAASLLAMISTAQGADLITTEEMLSARVDYLEQRLKDSDFDNDGFSPVQGDCDDSDATVNPGSNTAEIGGDGIDNNCDGATDNVPLSSDVDLDGLTDWEECSTYHTDPGKTDTDGDSLPAAGKWESYQCNCKQVCTQTGPFGVCAKYSTVCSTCQRWVESNPAVNMSDGLEVFNYGTSPILMDSDGDHVNDGTEIRNKTNPLNPANK